VEEMQRHREAREHSMPPADGHRVQAVVAPCRVSNQISSSPGDHARSMKSPDHAPDTTVFLPAWSRIAIDHPAASPGGRSASTSAAGMLSDRESELSGLVENRSTGLPSHAALYAIAPPSGANLADITVPCPNVMR